MTCDFTSSSSGRFDKVYDIFLLSKRAFSWRRLSFDVCFEDIIESKDEERDAFGARMPLLHGWLSNEPRVLGKPCEMCLLAPYLPADGCHSPVEASGFAARWVSCLAESRRALQSALFV